MNLVRTIVSGKKNRMIQGSYDMDLTYITPRIIAMSYPGSSYQKVYRNNINDVAAFLQERHGTYFKIYNVSGIDYNEKDYLSLFFGNQKENKADAIQVYHWQDHHSPPLDMLFKICKDIHQFLKEDSENVIVVHCLAGKGRTGTVICCYLLYSQRFNNCAEALEYYMKKRFRIDGGVNQPSQIRYVQYFHQLLKDKSIQNTVPLKIAIDDIKIFYQIKLFNFQYFQAEFHEVTQQITKNQQKKQNLQEEEQHAKKTSVCSYSLDQGQELCSINLKKIEKYGDILIYVNYKQEFLCRFSFNTAFLKNLNYIEFNLEQLDPDSIYKQFKQGKNKKFNENFKIQINFNPIKQQPQADNDWKYIQDTVQEWQKNKISKQDSNQLLFQYQEFDDVIDILYGVRNIEQFKDIKKEDINNNHIINKS